MDRRTAFRGQGAGVLPPRNASHAWGRASPAFSSRRPSRPLFRRPAAPVRTAAAPEPAFQAQRLIGRLAQLFLRQTVPPRLAPSAGSRRAVARTRGPRPSGHRRRCPIHRGRPARGRRRFAPPCRPSREQLDPPSRSPWAQVASCTTQRRRRMPAAGRGAVRPLVQRAANALRPRARRTEKSFSSGARAPSGPAPPGILHRPRLRCSGARHRDWCALPCAALPRGKGRRATLGVSMRGPRRGPCCHGCWQRCATMTPGG